MRISVVVPTRNHSTDLEKCLRSIQKQTKESFEKILVAYSDGDVGKAAKKYGFRVVHDKKRTIGNAYYVGANAAKGDIVVFIDDDSVAPKNLLKKIEYAFKKNPDIDLLGGDDRLPPNSSSFQEAAYQTDEAIRPKEKKSGNGAWKWLRAACIAYRKESLKKCNFDKRLTGLQEPELHERMKKAGMKALYDPTIFVYHKRRNSLKGIWDQIYRNGKAKIDFIRLHPETISIYDVAPFVFIIYSLLMMYLGYYFLWLTSIVFYFLLKTLIISLKSDGVKYYLHLLPIVITREIAYCFGILLGIFRTWGRL